MIRSDDFEISDAEAIKMPFLFQKLREGYFEWRATGVLPDGKAWQPPQQELKPDV